MTTQAPPPPAISGKFVIGFVGLWTAFTFGLEIPGWNGVVAMFAVIVAGSVTLVYLPDAVKGLTG